MDRKTLERLIDSKRNQLNAINDDIDRMESGDEFYNEYDMYHHPHEVYDLSYQRDSIENELMDLEDQLEKLKEKDNFYVIASKREKQDGLLDLRNINGVNFRKNENATGNESPSKSYFMNRDFLVIDSLSLKSYDTLENPEISNILHGIRENIEKAPLIQPLILNEFQPYDMLSPADLMPGGIMAKVTDGIQKGAEMLGGNVLISLGKNILMKTNIDKFSKNPELLYRMHEGTRKRKYFSSDPVQVVQNMFNGGRWLNTFQIPYYGNEYLSAKHSKNWKLTGSETFFGNALAGGTPAVGQAPELSTKRIWY
jgi:hypothetical protein